MSREDHSRHSDAAIAAAYRTAAETVKRDPYFPESDRAEREAFYRAEAERIEGRVG